ncbi:MAG: tetratricopeptide repeat protein [Acidobacteriia bacterium]|nr:tetratricopeptide repeat protein [Terriglobia bacterium]
MLSADLRDPSKCWPLLRAQLEQWTNWFRYRRTAGTAPPGFDIPRQPLILSRELVCFLAANLPRELLRRFQPELVDGEHRDAFNQSLLRILGGLEEELRPLDPVRHIREFPEPGEAFLPDLAMALNNQANCQSAMGQRGEALQSIQEAVENCRELVGKNREAFLPGLALSHGAWGNVLLGAEKPLEAAEKFAEGVRLITPLASKLPQAYFQLAQKLARQYRNAASAAGIEPDPGCTWPLDALGRASQPPGGEE